MQVILSESMRVRETDRQRQRVQVIVSESVREREQDREKGREGEGETVAVLRKRMVTATCYKDMHQHKHY